MNDKIVACNACELRKYCDTPLTPVSTWENIELIVATDRPTKDENKCQWSWGDRNHQYAQKLIEKVFDPEKTHYTYLTKCYNAVTLGKKNVSPCLTFFLTKEIEQLKPSYILYLGSIFTKLHKTKFKDKLVTFIPYPYIQTYWQSPSVIFNSGKTKDYDFIDFLEKFKGSHVYKT